MLKKLLLLFASTSLFISCNTEQKMPENFDYGTMENGIYTNDYFKFRFSYDESWNIQSQEQMAKTAQLGADMITNETTRNTVKATDVNTANLFSAFRHDLDAEPVEYNYSIVVVAENIKMFPEVKRGKDYLNEAKKLMSQTVIDYDFPDAYETMDVGGKSFDVMKVTGRYMGASFKQEYLTTIINGFSFSLILSYDTNTQRQELQNLIDGMDFNTATSKKAA